MNTKRFFPLAFILLCCAFLGVASRQSLGQSLYAAHVNNYGLQNTLGGYSTIVGAKGTTQLFNSTTYPYDIAYNSYVNISMPFLFSYDSVDYPAGSNLQIRYDGKVVFGDINTNYDYGNDLGNTNFANMIMGFGTLYSGFTNYYSGNAGLFYNVTGTAPNRVVTVEWYNYTWNYYYGWNYGYTINQQIRLYETSNNIAINYSCNNCYQYYVYYIGGIGLNGQNASPFKSYVIRSSPGDYYGDYPYSPSTNYLFTVPQRRFDINLSSAPKTVNFGSVQTGSTANQNVTVTHVGKESQLTISKATITGDPDFTVVSIPGPTNPGKSNNIVVKFAPTQDGLRSAVMTIISNGTDSGVQTIALQGIGLAPLIAIDSNIKFKGKITKMGTTLIQPIVISSVGGGSLFWTSFNFTGLDGGEYQVAKYPAANPIPAGKQDTLWVAYVPTKEGRHIATMNIINNSINNPVLPVTLWGTATLPHIALSPGVTIPFDSVYLGDEHCTTLTIKNPGTDTLLLLRNYVSSNDGDFTISTLSGTDTIIPPDKSQDITICFKPKQFGSRAARLLLKTNIIPTFESVRRDTAGTISINITGNGVPVGLLSQSISGAEGAGFNDSTIVGTTVCIWDTIRNNGDADLTVSSAKLSGSNMTDFTVSGLKTPFIIKAHSVVIAQICGTPSAAGLRNASLAITGMSNGKSITSTSSLNVFGWTVCATADPSPLFKDKLVLDGTVDTATVTITNCGDVPTSYTASLPNGTVYSLISPATSAIVAPKATTNFMVTFAPTTMGALPATLTVTPSTPELAAITVPMTGVGACASVVAQPVTIPPTGADGHSSFTVTIDNALGNYAWTAGTPLVTPNDGIFTVTSTTIADASANGTTTINMDFHPSQVNTPYSAQLSFPNAAPSCAPPLTVALTQTSTSASVDTRSEIDGFKLGQNRPNPFTTTSVFTFTTPTEAAVRLTVSDVTGKVVKIISDGRVSAGEHNVTLEANDFSSGTYVLTLQSGTTTLAKTFVVTK